MHAAAAFSILFVYLQSSVVADKAREATHLVRESADAHGGQEQLAAAQKITFEFSGAANFPYQGPTPDQPGEFQYAEATEIDYAENELRVKSGFTGGETAFMQTASYDADDYASQSMLARQLRQSPHALLREWIKAPRGLILVDQTRKHWIVSGLFYGTMVHAYINRDTMLVDRIETPFNDVRYGDASAILEFSDYRERRGWRLPGRLRVVEAGSTILDLPYERYEVGLSSTADEGDVTATAEPENSSDVEPSRPADREERPSAETFLATDYGDYVRVLYNTGGPNYHSLAVATDDGVVVIETPGSVIGGRDLVERASALGEVRYVAATHHHGDHAAAMPGVVAPNHTVVVAESQREFFNEMITAPRHFLPIEFEPVADPQFLTVPPGGMKTIGARVIAYDAGPSGHSDAHIVYYVPEAKLLFQSDMAVFQWDGGVEPARQQTCRMQAFIEANGLEVEVIAGGHGRPGSVADLEKAIAQRPEGCV